MKSFLRVLFIYRGGRHFKDQSASAITSKEIEIRLSASALDLQDKRKIYFDGSVSMGRVGRDELQDREVKVVFLVGAVRAVSGKLMPSLLPRSRRRYKFKGHFLVIIVCTQSKKGIS